MKYEPTRAFPVPSEHPSSKGLSAALRGLSPGWSVLFPEGTINSVSKMAHQVLGRGNFCCRTVEGGIRVWRLK